MLMIGSIVMGFVMVVGCVGFVMLALNAIENEGNPTLEAEARRAAALGGGRH